MELRRSFHFWKLVTAKPFLMRMRYEIVDQLAGYLFVHNVQGYFLETLAVFQISGIHLVVTFLFWFNVGRRTHRLCEVGGYTHTHTHMLEESRHWVCGSNGQLQWKDLCVAVAAILGSFSSGAFVFHPRRASSHRHKETRKRRES